MRAVLSSILILALLSGCLASDEDPADVPNDPAVAPPADLSDSVDVDLLDSGFDQTWTFDFAEGATGFFSVNLRTRMQGLIQPSACVTWTRTFPGGESHGTSGDCSQGGGNVNVVIGGADVMDGDRQVFHVDGDDLVQGHYTVQATAPAQANRLVVSIGIDNPPTDGDSPGPSA